MANGGTKKHQKSRENFQEEFKKRYLAIEKQKRKQLKTQYLKTEHLYEYTVTAEKMIFKRV